jgi:hypothetical protein
LYLASPQQLRRGLFLGIGFGRILLIITCQAFLTKPALSSNKTLQMKPVLNILIALLLLPSIIGCNKDDDNAGGGDTIASVITQGKWVVHYYLNQGKDETGNYSGYVFSFGSSGSLSATVSSNTNSGTWTELIDSGKRKLVITWSGGGIPVVLLELEDDWILKSKSSTLIELTNGTDELHFKKQ